MVWCAMDTAVMPPPPRGEEADRCQHSEQRNARTACDRTDTQQAATTLTHTLQSSCSPSRPLHLPDLRCEPKAPPPAPPPFLPIPVR